MVMRMTAMMTMEMMVTAVLMLVMTLGERCCQVCEERVGQGAPTVGGHRAAALGLLFCLPLPGPVLGTNGVWDRTLSFLINPTLHHQLCVTSCPWSVPGPAQAASAQHRLSRALCTVT